jgi:hypothetical protein
MPQRRERPSLPSPLAATSPSSPVRLALTLLSSLASPPPGGTTAKVPVAQPAEPTQQPATFAAGSYNFSPPPGAYARAGAAAAPAPAPRPPRPADRAPPAAAHQRSLPPEVIAAPAVVRAPSSSFDSAPGLEQLLREKDEELASLAEKYSALHARLERVTSILQKTAPPPTAP